MHEERYVISEETANEIMETKKQGNRIISVGTTSVRVLEHNAYKSGKISSGKGSTKLMIFPGYKFKIVDALITNENKSN